MEDLCVLTVNGHIIGGQIGVYITAQWYIKNVSDDLRLSVWPQEKAIVSASFVSFISFCIFFIFFYFKVLKVELYTV